MVKKHCENRRNSLLQAISPFLTMFLTAIYLKCICGIKMWHSVVMGYPFTKKQNYEQAQIQSICRQQIKHC